MKNKPYIFYSFHFVSSKLLRIKLILLSLPSKIFAWNIILLPNNKGIRSLMQNITIKLAPTANILDARFNMNCVSFCHSTTVTFFFYLWFFWVVHTEFTRKPKNHYYYRWNKKRFKNWRIKSPVNGAKQVEPHSVISMKKNIHKIKCENKKCSLLLYLHWNHFVHSLNALLSFSFFSLGFVRNIQSNIPKAYTAQRSFLQCQQMPANILW